MAITPASRRGLLFARHGSERRISLCGVTRGASCRPRRGECGRGCKMPLSRPAHALPPMCPVFIGPAFIGPSFPCTPLFAQLIEPHGSLCKIAVLTSVLVWACAIHESHMAFDLSLFAILLAENFPFFFSFFKFFFFKEDFRKAISPARAGSDKAASDMAHIQPHMGEAMSNPHRVI